MPSSKPRLKAAAGVCRGLQLFEERVKLVLRWFDLWTDGQRKHLMSSLLGRCTSSQLRCCRDLLTETVPVTRLDFTVVLPRVLSLKVMSFLNPRDLSAAARVSWHWRFLAEQVSPEEVGAGAGVVGERLPLAQDCLWTGRCIQRGWFLPYSPGPREYGAWKSHYLACVSTLDWLPPRKAAARYRSLSQQAGETEEEEEEERRTARRLRRTIRETIQEEKSELKEPTGSEKRRLTAALSAGAALRTRRAWGSSAALEAGSSRTPSSASGLTPGPSSGVSLSPERLRSSSLGR